MPKEIKEKIKEMKREIIMILDEEYGHQDACDRNPDRICGCSLGLVVDRLEYFADKILSLFEEEKQKWVEEDLREINKLVEKMEDQLPIHFLAEFYKILEMIKK